MSLPTSMPTYRPTIEILEKRTARKFVVDEVTKCWLWIGYIDKYGYGRVSVRSLDKLAHRWIYTLVHGDIPTGLTLDHLCRVRNCVNPSHLQPVTLQENIRRSRHYNTEKDVCKRGHEFTPENTYIFPNGKRNCRQCRKERGGN